MGQLHIPEPVFVHRVLPLERLIQGLVGALHESSQAESRPADAGCRRHCVMRRCVPARCAPPARRPGTKPVFYTTVTLGKYRPSDVNVKVDNGSVIIHARREERNGEDFDVTETRRVVKLPEALDGSKVLCFLRPDGRVLIKAQPVGTDSETEKETSMKESRSTTTGTANDDVKSSNRADTTDVKDREAAVTTYLKQHQSPADEAETSEKEALIDVRGPAVSTDDAMTPAHPESRETGEPKRAERENVDKLLTVDTDSDASLSEPDNREPLHRDENDDDDDVDDDDTDSRRQPSPTPSDDFSIIDEASMNFNAEFNPDTEVTNTENDEEQEEDADSLTAGYQLTTPLSDSVRIVEDGQQKNFELSLNLKDFDAENMAVRFVDNELFIDAKKESTDNGVYSLQEVHRKYPVPEAGVLDAARAQVTSDGMVTVTVPLDEEQKAQEMTVPIVQLAE